MPDPKKKIKKKGGIKDVSLTPSKRMRALTATGKEQGNGERDLRMASARQDKLDRDVKEAGGVDAYLRKASKAAKAARPLKKVGESITAYRKRTAAWNKKK